MTTTVFWALIGSAWFLACDSIEQLANRRVFLAALSAWITLYVLLVAFEVVK